MTPQEIIVTNGIIMRIMACVDLNERLGILSSFKRRTNDLSVPYLILSISIIML